MNVEINPSEYKVLIVDDVISVSYTHLQYFGIQSHRQSEHIDSPHHRCFGSLNRIMLVMNG